MVTRSSRTPRPRDPSRRRAARSAGTAGSGGDARAPAESSRRARQGRCRPRAWRDSPRLLGRGPARRAPPSRSQDPGRGRRRHRRLAGWALALLLVGSLETERDSDAWQCRRLGAGADGHSGNLRCTSQRWPLPGAACFAARGTTVSGSRPSTRSGFPIARAAVPPWSVSPAKRGGGALRSPPMERGTKVRAPRMRTRR